MQVLADPPGFDFLVVSQLIIRGVAFQAAAPAFLRA